MNLPLQYTPARATPSLLNGAAFLAIGLLPFRIVAADPLFASGVLDPFGLPDVGDVSSIELIDINGNGTRDAFIGSMAGTVRYFRNSGSTTSPAFGVAVTNPFGLVSPGTGSAPTFGDIDGDGDFDAFFGTYAGTLTFFRNTGSTGSPTFAAPVVNPFGLVDVGSTSTPELVDIDGDGDLDLFVGEYSGDIRLFRNTGNSLSPAFDGQASNPFGLYNTVYFPAPATSDVDGDGDFDMLLGNIDGSLLFFRNTGNPTNPSFSSSVLNPFGFVDSGSRTKPTARDIDGDGDVDLFVGRGDGRAEFFRNTIGPTLPAGIVRLDPTTNDLQAVRFQMAFNESVAPTFTAEDLQLTGAQSANAKAFLTGPAGDPTYVAYVIMNNPDSNGTVGIRISGSVTGSSGHALTVPINSPLYTISNPPKGDVNKNGTFDINDVALLADANLGLATLP